MLALFGLVCVTFHWARRSGQPLMREGSRMDCSVSFKESLQWIYPGSKVHCDRRGHDVIFSRHREGPFAKNRPTCLWMSGIPMTGDNARKASCSLRYSSHRLAETWNSSLELKAKFSSATYPKVHASRRLPPLWNKGVSRYLHCSMNHTDLYKEEKLWP